MRPKIKRELNPKELKFIELYLAGTSGTDSVIGAGYSPKSAHTRSRDLLKTPLVKARVEEHRASMQKKTEFGIVQAMAEAERAMDFAYLRNNPMAVVKATELRSKLAGLLIERHDVNVNLVSIDSALQAASSRVLPLLLEQPKPENEIIVTADELEPVKEE